MISVNKIKEIAEYLECGLKVYIHKISHEILFIPDDDNLDIDMEAWGDQLEQLENNFTDFYEIEKWTSNESFEIMKEFTEILPENSKIRNQLIQALNFKKPFREFKYVIDNSGPYRKHWFEFKDQQLQEYVVDQLKNLSLLK